MIEAGGIYLYAASSDDRVQRVRVRRISQDGRRADVVGEMNGVWMKHGWRTRVSRLAPLSDVEHVGDQTPCQRSGCGHPWAAHAYDDPTSVCREIVNGDDPTRRYDPYLNQGHRWCGCQQFV